MSEITYEDIWEGPVTFSVVCPNGHGYKSASIGDAVIGWKDKARTVIHVLDATVSSDLHFCRICDVQLFDGNIVGIVGGH